MNLSTLSDINVSKKLLNLIEDEKESSSVDFLTLLCLNQDGIPEANLRKLFFFIHPEEEGIDIYLSSFTRASFVFEKNGLILMDQSVKNLTIDQKGLVKDILPWKKVAKSILKGIELNNLIQDGKTSSRVDLLALLCLVNQVGISESILRKLFLHIHPEEEELDIYLSSLTKASFVFEKNGLILLDQSVKNLTIDEIGLVKDILPWEKVATSILKGVDCNSLTNEEILEVMQIWTNASRDKDFVLENIEIPGDLCRTLETFSKLQENVTTWKEITLKFAKANLTLLENIAHVKPLSSIRSQVIRLTPYLEISKELQAHEDEEVYEILKNIHDSPDFEGDFFGSPLLNCKPMSKEDVENAIRRDLIFQYEKEKRKKEPTIETAALMIHSCNNPQKVKLCVNILCKILDNFIEDDNWDNNISSDLDFKKIEDLRGVKEYLEAVGLGERSFNSTSVLWDKYKKKYWYLDPENRSVVDIIKYREILKTTKPIKPELDENLQIISKEEVEKTLDKIKLVN